MTFKRTIRYYCLRLRRLQHQPVAVQAPDMTAHVCRHCGYEYVGRLCPMCGMPGSWQRFTWQRLFNGFLDIWGMGNRPMFRSMGHLLWRPGYMIRDYLGGHYLSYFPPFKMLAVLTVFVALIIWLLGIDTASAVAEAKNTATALNEQKVVGMFYQVRDILVANPLYRLLMQIVLMVVAIWAAFYKRGLNFVETFFAMVYISCQMQLLTILWLLLTREFVEPSAFPFSLPEVLVGIVLLLDLRQLYQLSWWGTFWRMLLAQLLSVVLYVAVMFLTVILLIIGSWVV